MPYKLSERSKKNLDTCCDEIKRLVYAALEEYDVVVIEGHRDKEAQDLYYKEGKSKLKWPDSRHNKVPSLAVDLGVYSYYCNGIDWKNEKLFHELAGYMKAVARQYRIAGLRWGGDYKTFKDLPHFEIIT